VTLAVQSVRELKMQIQDLKIYVPIYCTASSQHSTRIAGRFFALGGSV